MYKGCLVGFPEEIVERMLEEQVAQGNPRDITVFENDKSASRNRRGMSWTNTKEGHTFWELVINYKDFKRFFDLYPTPKTHEELAIRLSGCLEKCANELKELKQELQK